MAQVLDLMGFVPSERHGDQLRGPCPIHGSTSETSRTFSANLANNAFRCFRCGKSGNQLDLSAAVRNTELHYAATTLCQQFGLPVPYIVSVQNETRSSATTETEKRNP